MSETQKGKSPFYPGQPVPVELFVGRASQIERILTRGAGQVALGKSIAVYVEGEYGIGKSSIAGLIQRVAEEKYGLFGIYVSLGGVKTIEELARSVMEATLRSGVMNPTRRERMTQWLTKYLGKAELFGFSLNLETIRQDAPQLTNSDAMLAFLKTALSKLQDTGVKGIMLVLDEINGIASEPKFSHFIKGIVDTNAMNNEPLPLFLMLCGVPDRRREMIRNHEPVARLFDVVEIQPMTEGEMWEFFTKAFSSVGISIEPTAMATMTKYAAGLPRIMHLIGDAAYWVDKDGKIDSDDAFLSVVNAADEIGKKHVDHQIYAALGSDDYRSILDKIAKLGPSQMSFSKHHIVGGLNDTEKRKFNNFLQRMKGLHVLRPGNTRGEWEFINSMVRLYIWMKSLKKNPD